MLRGLERCGAKQYMELPKEKGGIIRILRKGCYGMHGVIPLSVIATKLLRRSDCVCVCCYINTCGWALGKRELTH